MPDERPEVVKRFASIAYMRVCPAGQELVASEVCPEHTAKAGEPVEVRMSPDLWRLVSRVTAAGWANAEALKRAGQWATPGQ